MKLALNQAGIHKDGIMKPVVKMLRDPKVTLVTKAIGLLFIIIAAVIILYRM